MLDKAGLRVELDIPLDPVVKPRFVGRGGLKLKAALEAFQVDPEMRICLDIGASTGGFTDCLLQHGAAKVFAYDVGHSQLDWRIRSDPRVVVAEGVNCRNLRASDLPEPISLVVIDVSFISLTKILPAAVDVLSASKDRGEIIALVKPQFELERAAVGKGGIVREAAEQERAVTKIANFVRENLPMYRWRGKIDSPIRGADGNREFLVWLSRFELK